ncbi:MAG: DEAD/DEAH box helicase family protein [Syntrophales bacterium]|nr:DEAD/DEAH box helicase family protein [Syntrophales bacterium]
MPAMAIVNTMAINLDDQQKTAVDKLKSGSILCGGVGSGKSRTALAYYFMKECGGRIKINGVGEFTEMKNPKDLYIITTSKKRDTLEWEGECAPFMISTKKEHSISGVKVTVDSWNNLRKYIGVRNSFFIFDEQRLVGSGTWVKSFLKIVKANNWILLSATPGDTWTDYIPVFLANGFYKNRTQFLRRHAVYNRFTRYPKIEKYIEEARLSKLRDSITISMNYQKSTISHNQIKIVSYDKEAFNKVLAKRWNIYENRPVKAIGELCYLLRKVVNSDPSRIDTVKQIIKIHPKLIIFYNFDYELEMLRKLGEELHLRTGEWNGHVHQEVPDGETWLYLVQYSAGAEGWNCIKTDTTVFFSQNYSYKIMVQAAGRIDRRNTPFKDLYYYHIRSNSIIDLAIAKAIRKKRDFNIHRFMDV